jgi:hypothetical protein
LWEEKRGRVRNREAREVRKLQCSAGGVDIASLSDKLQDPLPLWCGRRSFSNDGLEKSQMRVGVPNSRF